MTPSDRSYFETKDAIDIHIAGGEPLPSDLIEDAIIHGVSIPAGPAEAWEEDIDGPILADVASIQMTASV